MKVYFDARMIDHPGIGRYIRCLLPLIAKDKSIDLRLLGDRAKITKLLSIDAELINFDYPIYSIREQLGFLNIKKTVGDGILHVPHYNVPVSAKFNLIATIHDLIHIIYPEGASNMLAHLYMKFMMKRILSRARTVICVSQATKDVIEERLLRPVPYGTGLAMTEKNGNSPNQRGIGAMGQSPFLTVIHEGIDKVFTKITDSEQLRNIKKKYRLPDKFMLYVGSIRRHKNISGLLGSFERFNKKAPDIWLVMVGKYSQPIELNRKKVIYLGEIASDADLAGIYNQACCLFNLSLYEGFSLTILEAQRCGLPVVCSDIPVHKEIGGEGIAAANPSSIDQIDENLYNVLFNNDIKEGLISKGLDNTRRFDWSISAKSTIDIYRKVWNEGSDSSRLVNRHAGRGKDT